MVTIGLDTNIFIYYFHKDKDFGENAREVFQLLASDKKKAITSIITLTELLALKMSDKDVTILQNTFFQIPNLSMFDIDQKIALEAAKIRREYGYRLPDAIQLATATHTKADLFITNDIRLKKYKETKVILLEEFK